MKNISKKSLALAALILSFLTSDFALAETAVGEKATQTKASTKAKNTEFVKDPDLKLSIEELKKKYPISLLDQKKKNYKQGQKINLDDYSIEEIKAAFLNADRNFKSKNYISKKDLSDSKSRVTKISLNLYEEFNVIDYHQLLVMEQACENFGTISDPKSITNDKVKIRTFMLSSKIWVLIHNYIPESMSNCLLEEDRN